MMINSVSNSADAIIEDLIARLESCTGSSEGWATMIREVTTPVLFCDHTLTINQANEALNDLTGYDPESLIGTRIRDLPLSLLSGESVWDAALTRRTTTGVVELQAPSGPVIFRLTSLPVTDSGGVLVSVLLICTTGIHEPSLPSYDQIRRTCSDPAEVLVQSDGTILSVSDPAAAMLEDTPKALIWKKFQEISIFQENDRKEVFSLLHHTPGNSDSECILMAGEKTLFCSARIVNGTLLKRPVIHITLTEIPRNEGSATGEMSRLLTLIGGDDPKAAGEDPANIISLVDDLCHDLSPIQPPSLPLTELVRNLLKERDFLWDLFLTDSHIPEPDDLIPADRTRMIQAMLTSFMQDIQLDLDADGAPVADQKPLVVDQYRGVLAAAALTMNFLIWKADGKSGQEKEPDGDDSFLSDVSNLASRVVSGDLSARIIPKTGDELVAVTADALNIMVEHIEGQFRVLADCISQMKTGFIPTGTGTIPPGPFEPVIRDLDEALNSLQTMIATTESLTMSVMEGNLTARGETLGLGGYYKALVTGMNRMLSLISEPLGEIRRVGEEYARCRFDARMDEKVRYPGDFAVLKSSMDAIGIYCQGVVCEIDRVCSGYASGDFTVRMSQKLEVTGDFMTIRDSLDNIGVRISQSITDLRSSVATMDHEAGDIRSGIAIVSGQAQTLAAYAMAVSDRAARVGCEVGEMITGTDSAMNSLHKMTTRSESIASISSRTNLLSSQGRELADRSREGMDAISGSTGLVSSGIGRIQEEITEIGKIIRVITGITNQTNMLAINAAIEAAHAGIYGKGFAVVAAEVKHLANDSKTALLGISETLVSLNEAFEEVSNAAQGARGEVDCRGEAIRQMISLFEEMSREIEQVAAMSSEAVRVAAEQERMIQGLDQRARLIGDLMMETTDDAKASSEACNESCRSVEEISWHIESVAGMADRIHTEIGRFSV